MNIKEHFPDIDTNTVSDGYHTFGELYEHRITLFLVLMLRHPNISWRSRNHADGSEWEGWFIAGIQSLTKRPSPRYSARRLAPKTAQTDTASWLRRNALYPHA
jgi:hypothetical protein